MCIEFQSAHIGNLTMIRDQVCWTEVRPKKKRLALISRVVQTEYNKVMQMQSICLSGNYLFDQGFKEALAS